jgi:hypothetical protein
MKNHWKKAAAEKISSNSKEVISKRLIMLKKVSHVSDDRKENI